jgi:hypothetical protein
MSTTPLPSRVSRSQTACVHLAEQHVPGRAGEAVLLVAQHHEQQVEEGAHRQVRAKESPKQPPAKQVTGVLLQP